MNDQPDPLVLVGGPLTIQNLVKQYASLKGWERVQEIAPPKDGNLATWSQRTVKSILERSKPGDKIVIFLPESSYLGWLKTLEASGRLTDIPLYNLSLARQLEILHRWIKALESKPGPSSLFARILEKFKVSSRLFLKRIRPRSPGLRQE